MGRILIASPRQTFDGSASATTHADWPATSLLAPSPSEWARLTDGANGFPVTMTLAQRRYNLIAALYATVSEHKNLLPSSADIAAWTATRILAATNEGVFSTAPAGVEPIFKHKLVPNTTADTHYVEAPYTGGVAGTQQATASFYIDTALFDAYNAEYRVYGAGGAAVDFAQVTVRHGTGIVQSSGAGGTFTLDAATVTQVAASTLYKVVLTFTTTAAATLTLRVSVLNGGYVASYAGDGSSSIQFGGATLEPGATAGAPIVNRSTGTCSYWQPDSATDAAEAFTRARDLQWHRTVFGWTHGWKHYATTRATPDSGQVIVKFWDKQNIEGAGFIDVSQIIIADAFQPAINFEQASLTVDLEETGEGSERYRPRGLRFRNWTLRLIRLTRDEARRILDRIIAEAGRSGPVLVILDPDETDVGQAGAVYGFIERAEVSDAGYSAVQNREVWQIELGIKEQVP